MKITIEMLREKDACPDQVKLFAELFPEGAEATYANADRAFKANLDIEWAARHLLSPKGLAEYKRIEGLAMAEYERIEGPALAEYERIKGPTWAEYERIEGPARAEYERKRARAFVDAVKGEAWK